MPLTFCASFCSTAAASAEEDSIQQPDQSRSLHLTTSSASDTSSSSDAPSSSSTDDNVSLQTLPSIPSVNSLNPPLTFTPTSTTFTCLASIPTGRASTAIALSDSHIYSASESDISVLSLNTHHKIASLPVPSGTGSLKCIVHTGKRILTAHQDGRIRVWHPSTHSLTATLPTTIDRLLHFPFPQNYVAIRRHKHILWVEHADAVSALTVNNGLIYTVSWDKTLKIWHGSSLRCLESVKAHDDAINAVAVAGDGTVYTGSADRRIRVWVKGVGDRRHGLVATLERHVSAVNALALNGDGSVLYSGACDRSILVWEREESASYMGVVGALRGHKRAIMCLVCVGDLVVSGSSDRTVRVWRRGGESYNCLAVMDGHLSGVRSLAAVRMADENDDDEEYKVCSGSVDGEVRVWRVRVGSFKKPESESESLATLE